MKLSELLKKKHKKIGMFQKPHTKWVGIRDEMKTWLDYWMDMRMPLGESLKVHSTLLAEKAGNIPLDPLSVIRCQDFEVYAPRFRCLTLIYKV